VGNAEGGGGGGGSGWGRGGGGGGRGSQAPRTLRSCCNPTLGSPRGPLLRRCRLLTLGKGPAAPPKGECHLQPFMSVLDGDGITLHPADGARAARGESIPRRRLSNEDFISPAPVASIRRSVCPLIQIRGSPPGWGGLSPLVTGSDG